MYIETGQQAIGRDFRSNELTFPWGREPFYWGRAPWFFIMIKWAKAGLFNRATAR